MDRFYIGLCALVSASFIWRGLIQHPIAFPMDDAYITIHNAQTLLTGTDKNYPGVPALMGATSLVHLALVAALMFVFSPLVACFVTGGAGAVLYAAGLAALAFQVGGSVMLAVVITSTGMLAGYAPYHLLNGLETGMAMAAVTWALVFASRSDRSLKLPILCGLLPFIRPELAALSALLIARQSVSRWRAAEGVGAIMLDLALAAGVAAPWLCWTWYTLGTLMPPTATAKVAFFAEAALPPAVKIQMILSALWQSGIMPLMLGAALLRPTSLLWLFALALLGAFYLTFPGGLGQNFSRYDFVLLPVFLCLLTQAAQRGPFSAWAAIILCIASTTACRPALSAYADATDCMRSDVASVANWAETNIPPSSRVLIHDAGYVAFATNLQLVDMVGLKTPESVGYHQSLTAPSGGVLRGSAISEIAQHFNVEYAIIFDDKGRFWGDLADGLRRQGWTMTPAQSPVPQTGYIIYRLTKP